MHDGVTRAEEALAALRAVPQLSIVRAPREDIVVRRVRWSSRELFDWFHYLSAELHGVGLTAIGIDSRRNRIGIGVSNERAWQVAQARLVSLRIPCELVILAVQPAGRL